MEFSFNFEAADKEVAPSESPGALKHTGDDGMHSTMTKETGNTTVLPCTEVTVAEAQVLPLLSEL